MKVFFLTVTAFFLSICSFVSAGTVRLQNDSAYQLRAVIRGADGSYMGELVLVAQSQNTWTDAFGHYGGGAEANSYERKATLSQTPYTVLWYCMDGSDFSVCSNVATGSLVSAQQGDGRRICKPSPQTPGSYRSNKAGQENILPEPPQQ